MRGKFSILSPFTSSLKILVLNKICRKILTFLLSLVLLFLFLCIHFSSWPTHIFRRIIRWYAKGLGFRPDLGEPVFPRSNFFAADDAYSKPTGNVVAYMMMNGHVDVEKFRRDFKSRVIELKKDGRKGDFGLVYPELRQSWTTYFGYLWWKWEEKFNLDEHIRNYDYGKISEAETETTDENSSLLVPSPCRVSDLLRIKSSLFEMPWKKGKSPWEFLFIHNFVDSPSERLHSPNLNPNQNELNPPLSSAQTKTKTVCLIRFHHGLGDGYSFLRLIMNNLGGVNNRVAQPKASFTKPRKNPVTRLISNICLPLRLPYDFTEHHMSVFDVNPWHLPANKLSRKCYSVSTKQIHVDYIKGIKNNHGVSFLSTLIAATSGGFRKIMMEVGQQVPKEMNALVPFPMKNHPGGLVNHLTFVFGSFPTGKDTPLKRLAAAVNGLNRLKNSTVPMSHYGLTYLAGELHNKSVKMFNCNHFATLSAANFPGPDEATTLLGYPVSDFIVGTGFLRGNLGATVCWLSCCGYLRVCIDIDRSVFPSEEIFQKLGQYIEQEFDELHRLGLELQNTTGTTKLKTTLQN